MNAMEFRRIPGLYYLSGGYDSPFVPTLVDPLLVEPMAYPYMDLATLEDYVNDTGFGYETPQIVTSHVCPEPMCHREFKRVEHLHRHLSSMHLETCASRFAQPDSHAQHMKPHFPH